MKTKRLVLTTFLSLIALFSVCDSVLGGIKITPTGTSGGTIGISYFTSKGNGTADPHYSANEDLRIYAKGTISITSEYGCMSSIVFNISTQGRTRLASITADTGTISEQTSGATTVTWTGNARRVTLTVGDKADYGSGDHSKAGQLCFTDFVVELDGNTRVEGDIIMFADKLVRNECLAKWDKNNDDRLSLSEAAAVENLGSFWNTLTYDKFTSFDELRFFTRLTSIDANAFVGCRSLTSIIIPESVTCIEIGAFEGCSSLTSITIPENVTDIERNAFLSCSGLQDIYIYAIDVPTTGTNSFDEDIYRNSTLHVPAFSLHAYRATEPWSKFGNIVANDDYDLPNVTGKTFRLSCARGYVGYNGSTLCGTSQEAASKFAIVDYGNTNYLYDVTNKAFVIHTTAAKAGTTGNILLENNTVFSKAVKGLTWGKTYINDYPYYLEDYFGNWLNMSVRGAQYDVCMNTWQDFEDGYGGNTYQIEVVNDWFDASEALEMLDSYFASHHTFISNLSELSNLKQYIIYTKDEARGSLGVADGGLASTNPMAQAHKCEEASAFAILEYEGNYYLYSTADSKFITNTGSETDAPGKNGTQAVTLTKNSNGYFMISFTSTGNVLNINSNPGIAINTWGQTPDKWDEGNQFTIEEVGDFDPTEALAMFGTAVVEVTDEQYQAALQTVETDVQYNICTDYHGTRYYMTPDGYLTETATEAGVFTFLRTEGDGLYRSPGWKLDACFSNPKLSNDASGELNPQGHILTDKGNNRINWEGQVWYLGDNGCYAVRATNAVSDTWGANTYWTVLDTDGNGKPEADYSWTPNFVWQIEKVQDTMGDVNGDNEVDLTDAIMIVYYSLGTQPAGFNTIVADMNDDGVIDLTDAIIVVYMSLGAQLQE